MMGATRLATQFPRGPRATHAVSAIVAASLDVQIVLAHPVAQPRVARGDGAATCRPRRARVSRIPALRSRKRSRRRRMRVRVTVHTRTVQKNAAVRLEWGRARAHKLAEN